MDQLWVILLAFGVPSAITGLGMWRVQALISKAEKRREYVEDCREKYQIVQLKSINAAITLGEATACAIKNGHCNGEVSDALDYAKKVKHEQRDFLQEMGVKSII